MARKFDTQRPLLISPHLQAQIFADWFVRMPIVSVSEENGVGVVKVSGCMWREDHADILSALSEAVAKFPSGVFEMDSGGGEADFCFEMARAAQKMIASSGKRWVTYVPAMALSAGYAWACVCPEIYAAPEASVGSIGVIQMLCDASENLAKIGVKFTAVTSGQRKADGHPDIPLSDEARNAVQATVDGLAQSFFELVAGSRKIEASAVEALQAGIFLANASGSLVNGIRSRADLLSDLAANRVAIATPSEASGTGEKKMNLAAMKKELKAQADAGDKEAAAALAKLEAPEDPPAEEETDDEEPAAEDPKEEEPEAEADVDALAQDPKAAAAVIRAMQASAKTTNARLAKIEADGEREKIFATRPDLAPETRAELSALDPKSLRVALKAIPKGVGAVTPGATGAPVQGNVSGAPGRGMSDEERQGTKQRLGTAKDNVTPITKNASSIRFGTPRS